MLCDIAIIHLDTLKRMFYKHIIADSFEPPLSKYDIVTKTDGDGVYTGNIDSDFGLNLKMM